jgi:hypothetical protein
MWCRLATCGGLAARLGARPKYIGHGGTLANWAEARKAVQRRQVRKGSRKGAKFAKRNKKDFLCDLRAFA